MSCSEFWNDPPDLRSAAAELPPHLSECAACAARFERHRRLQAALRAMALDDRSTGAPPRVEANLLAAFRAAQKPQTRVVPFRLRTATPFLAAAAALILAAGVWLWPRHGEAPAAHHRQTSHVELADADGSNAPEPGMLDEEGFIPLPNTQKLEPGDDVNVVRMELPRSAMMAVGYDVNPESASEMVEADVALGPDGLARAVKFLDSASL